MFIDSNFDIFFIACPLSFDTDKLTHIHNVARSATSREKDPWDHGGLQKTSGQKKRIL